jgi:very-short-patch-repair endonuclease
MSRPRHTSVAADRARQLRSSMTISEARLWNRLRRGGLGVRFRRQVPIGVWIVDFATFDPRLVIEVDDRSHHWRDETERTAYLEARGFAVLRIPNRLVATDLDAAVGLARNWVDALGAKGEAPPY